MQSLSIPWLVHRQVAIASAARDPLIPRHLYGEGTSLALVLCPSSRGNMVIVALNSNRLIDVQIERPKHQTSQHNPVEDLGRKNGCLIWLSDLFDGEFGKLVEKKRLSELFRRGPITPKNVATLISDLSKNLLVPLSDSLDALNVPEDQSNSNGLPADLKRSYDWVVQRQARANQRQARLADGQKELFVSLEILKDCQVPTSNTR